MFGAAFVENGMPFEVLLVDDNAGDVKLLQEAFREVDASLNLHVANDGVEAVAFLEQEGDHAQAPRPDLVLLDLNLPRMDGREVLARIKADERLRQIPTLVLSVSDAEADVAKVYHLQANCYLIKPVEWDNFLRLVKSIKDFWLTTAKLPAQDDARLMTQSPPCCGRGFREATLPPTVSNFDQRGRPY